MNLTIVLIVYGLAAAVFVVLRQNKLAFPNLVGSLMPPKSATPSPWQMNRATLIQTLEENNIVFKHEWTVPELRAAPFWKPIRMPWRRITVWRA